jgi:hypothetical protein
MDGILNKRLSAVLFLLIFTTFSRGSCMSHGLGEEKVRQQIPGGRRLLQLNSATTVQGLVTTFQGIQSTITDLAQQWSDVPALAAAVGVPTRDTNRGISDEEQKYMKARWETFKQGDFILSGGIP